MSHPLVIAHRGASHDAPENTLEAFRLAWEQRADGIETDLRLCADGTVVAIHDADGRRTLRDRRRIRDLTPDDLAQLDAGSWKSPLWSAARVPTLVRILAEQPASRHLLLELKEADSLPERCADTIRASGVPLESIILIAFDETALTAVKRLLPECRALWLSKDYRAGASGGEALASKVREMGIDGVDLKFGPCLDGDLVAALHAHGLVVFTYTVNDAASVRRCAAIGLDALTTDRPADAIQWLADISA